MHPGLRPNNGNMFFNRGSGMQNMQGMSAGNCMPGNPGTMMNGGPGNGCFPPVNPGQTDLPAVSPRTDKSNICKNNIQMKIEDKNIINVVHKE